MKTIKNRNTSGRPAKNTDEKKNYKMTVKMASDEYDSLKAKAHEAGITKANTPANVFRPVSLNSA